MDLSIVIVNYNVKELLLKCLDSVFAFNTQNTEVIIADNASNDGSLEAVRQKYPHVILIENTINRGFPAANNQAFQIATGKYIFMLNPDTEFIEDAANKLMHYLEENPEVSIVAPQLLNTDGSLQHSVWRFPTTMSIVSEMVYLKKLRQRKNYDDQDKSKTFEAESFSGAAMMFRRSVLETVGMLDESLFWIEDVDFCYRIHKAGLKLVYYPAVKITHHISRSAKKNYRISISNQVYNKVKFYKKYKSTGSIVLMILISLIHAIAKLIIFFILSPFSIIYWRKATAYAYAIPRIFNPPKSL